MEKKLEKIFSFLEENREFNFNLQSKFYNSIVSSNKSKSENIISLLYYTANTQSQPKIDKLANFYRKIYENIDSLSSFDKFVKLINKKQISRSNFRNLFDGLRSQDGWGDKTAALFCKSIFHLHNGKYSDHLKIWEDSPTNIDEDDKLYLPVDTVIISIFSKIDETKNNFNKINDLIGHKYTGNKIEIWDDLWFWGFITQKVSKNNREFGWNENKYWSLVNSEKNPDKISIIKEKAENFLNIVCN